MIVKRRMVFSIIAALLSALAVYGLYYLQLQQINDEAKVRIVVPSQWIDAGHRISAVDVMLREIPLSVATDEMMYSIEELVGQEAVIPLGVNEPILRWKLNHFALHPGEGEATFQIPKDYVKSISNGIRAGDQVWLYASGVEGDSQRLFDQGVIVASVKTGSNVEVDIPDELQKNAIIRGNAEEMYASRRDANGMIEYINLNLTEAQWLEIDRLCNEGQVKLVIAYHSFPAPVKGQMNDE